MSGTRKETIKSTLSLGSYTIDAMWDGDTMVTSRKEGFPLVGAYVPFSDNKDWAVCELRSDDLGNINECLTETLNAHDTPVGIISGSGDATDETVERIHYRGVKYKKDFNWSVYQSPTEYKEEDSERTQKTEVWRVHPWVVAYEGIELDKIDLQIDGYDDEEYDTQLCAGGRLIYITSSMDSKFVREEDGYVWLETTTEFAQPQLGDLLDAFRGDGATYVYIKVGDKWEEV